MSNYFRVTTNDIVKSRRGHQEKMVEYTKQNIIMVKKSVKKSTFLFSSDLKIDKKSNIVKGEKLIQSLIFPKCCAG